MPRRCPDVSSPHLHRGEDLRCCALGKTDAGYGWLRVQLEQPGVLLLRCLGPRRAEGSGGRHVRRTGLDMLICRNENAANANIYAPTCILNHGSLDLIHNHRIAFPPFCSRSGRRLFLLVMMPVAWVTMYILSHSATVPSIAFVVSIARLDVVNGQFLVALPHLLRRVLASAVGWQICSARPDWPGTVRGRRCGDSLIHQGYHHPQRQHARAVTKLDRFPAPGRIRMVWLTGPVP